MDRVSVITNKTFNLLIEVFIEKKDKNTFSPWEQFRKLLILFKKPE